MSLRVIAADGIHSVAPTGEQRVRRLPDRGSYGRSAVYGPTALFPEDEPDMYPIIPLDSVQVNADAAAS